MCLCALAIGHGAGTPFTLPFLEFVTSDGTSLSAPDRMGTPVTRQAVVKPVPLLHSSCACFTCVYVRVPCCVVEL